MRRHSSVALDHGVLHFDGAAHGVDHAAEFDQSSIAGALYDTAAMHRDRRVDEIAAERPEAGKSAVLVRPGEPAETDHVGRQNRGKFASFCHPPPLCIIRIAHQRPRRADTWIYAGPSIGDGSGEGGRAKFRSGNESGRIRWTGQPDRI